MKCDHDQFEVNVGVHRLTETEGGPVTRYTTDISVKCGMCGLPFRFLGLPFGLHFAESRLSVDSLELRAPIEPAYVEEILGMPKISGQA